MGFITVRGKIRFYQGKSLCGKHDLNNTVTKYDLKNTVNIEYYIK